MSIDTQGYALLFRLHQSRRIHKKAKQMLLNPSRFISHTKSSSSVLASAIFTSPRMVRFSPPDGGILREHSHALSDRLSSSRCAQNNTN